MGRHNGNFTVAFIIILVGSLLCAGCGAGTVPGAQSGDTAENRAYSTNETSFSEEQTAGDLADAEGQGEDTEDTDSAKGAWVVFPVGRGMQANESARGSAAAGGDAATGGNAAIGGDAATGGNTATRRDATIGGNTVAGGNAAAGENLIADTTPPLLEQLFSYEIERHFGRPYLTITGIAEPYRDSFWETMSAITGRDSQHKYLLLPLDINGAPVRAVGQEAFAGMDIQDLYLPSTLTEVGEGAFRDTQINRLELPEDIERIGAGAFENCALETLVFPDRPLAIGERAFAGNGELWTVLIPNIDTVLEEGVFADCRDGFLLCYGDGHGQQDNLVAAYAREQGIDSMEIVLSKEPVVNYAPEPLTLRPEVRNYFYGDDPDLAEDQWCSWEEDEQAPNFGYSDWQWPGCSSWCGCFDFEQEVEASSELASVSGRYAPSNVLIQDRHAAWAEGVEGPGIGESLTYRQSCTYGIDNKWQAMTYGIRDSELDGFMRYSEICIVNGYARNQNTWEENGRVKKLLMYVEDRPYAFLELEDTILPQYFMLPEGDIKVLNGGMLEVRFEIQEVYPGSLYEDTCLTGLVMEFTGRYAH